ncbi:MAG: hypothetical protein JSR11_03755 [Bacteroidetes bacterium]|nr:hypothetical protein [Bacteroidota bacterium]
MNTKFLTFTMLFAWMTSCVTNRVTNVPNPTTIATIEKDRLQILGPVEGNSGGGRVWLLFIPIGWAKDSWIEGRAYKNALKDFPNADGIIDQVQTYHKTTIPLVIVTPQAKAVKVKGTAYHLRNDAELQEYLKTKEQK